MVSVVSIGTQMLRASSKSQKAHSEVSNASFVVGHDERSAWVLKNVNSIG